MTSVGKKIVATLHLMNWTQADFAKEADVHPVTVSHLKTGFTQKPNRDTKDKLKAVFERAAAFKAQLHSTKQPETKAAPVQPDVPAISPIILSRPDSEQKIVRIYYDKGSFISLKYPLTKDDIDKVVTQLNYIETK